MLFGISLELFVTNFPLGRYLFNLQEASEQKAVGRAARVQGSLRRHIFGESEFIDAKQGTEIDNQDILLTGPDSSATIAFDDGSTIELEPNTLVKISFQNQLSFGGISHAASVDVVTGGVTGHAKSHKIILRSRGHVVQLIPHAAAPPVARIEAKKTAPIVIPKVTATPSPLPPPAPPEVIVLQTPANGAHLRVKEGSPVPRLPVRFAWKASPVSRAGLPMEFSVWKLGEKPIEIFHQRTLVKKGGGVGNVVFSAPGKYEWEVKGLRSDTKSGFVIEPEFHAIATQEPLVGGHQINSSALKGKKLTDFNITIRWKPYTHASSYHVEFWDSPSRTQAIFQKTLSRTRFVLNRNKVYSGSLYYKISARLPTGFIVTSSVQPFTFRFLPPEQAVPKAGAVFSRQDLQRTNNTVLLTWQQTNFTDSYEIEIGRDPGFHDIYLNKKVSENFYIMMKPVPGTYWWRVKSFAKNIVSKEEAGRKFTIMP